MTEGSPLLYYIVLTLCSAVTWPACRFLGLIALDEGHRLLRYSFFDYLESHVGLKADLHFSVTCHFRVSTVRSVRRMCVNGSI
jgi:hypothetical protein